MCKSGFSRSHGIVCTNTVPGVAREILVRVYRQMFLGGLVVTWNQQDISRLLTLFQQGRFDTVIKTVPPLLNKQGKIPGLHDLAGAAFAARGRG